MKRIIVSTCLVVMLGGLVRGAAPLPSPAAPGPEAGLGLDQAVQIVLASHPELEALRLQAGAAGAGRELAGTLPEPMLTFGLMDDASTGTDWADAGEKRITVEQQIPWFGKRDLRRQISDQERESAEQALSALTLRLQRETKEVFHSLYATRRILAITRADAQVLQRIAELAEALYATGKRSQNDFFRASAEKTVLQRTIIALEAEEAVLGSTLNVLMNRAAQHPLEKLLPPPEWPAQAGVPADLQEAAGTRPNVLAALARAAQYGHQAELAQKDFWPDPVLGVEYRGNRSGQDMLMFMVGFSLPVWHSSRQAGVRQAELRRQANLAEARAAARQNALQIETARITLQAARQTLELYRHELLPQAEAGFQAGEAGYRNGQASFTELLENRRILLETRINIVATEGEVGRLAARLEEAADVVLTRTHGDQHP